jgi:hypothetical protein
MENYIRINAPPPPGIENKHAHIVGGGVAADLAIAALVAAWQSSEALKFMVSKKDALSPHLVHVDMW